ncbi:MAG: DUF4388 domain-containing protein [Proteobacteria bacterium]|nr:DUF4388 domain-containing protein [Pseudomonadota bacterium]
MSKQSLLLVDGDTRSLRVLEVSLRKAGFSVTTAETVRDALEKLELHPPELIVSETTFPDGDGFELRRRVRATPAWGEIPFIFLTAEQAIENKIRGLELGVDDYLTKPIYIKEIITRINILLQKRQRSRFEERDHRDDRDREGRRDGRTRFAGRISDMPVVDIIQTIEISRKSGVIQFIGERGKQATIYFRDGRVIDAEAGTLLGEDAVYRLLTWNDGEFEVLFRTVRRREVIQTSSQGLLMEGMRRLDEWSRILEQLPSLTHRFEVDATELAVRIGDVPDDNNRILRLIDGRRTLLEVIDASDVGDLECVQAIARLYFEEILHDLDHQVHERKRDTGKHAPIEDNAPTPIEEVASGPVTTAHLDEIEEEVRREASGPRPVVSVDAGSGAVPSIGAITSAGSTETQPTALEDVISEEPAPPGPLGGSYRPSSLRLIDEAVAAAQAIEPLALLAGLDIATSSPRAAPDVVDAGWGAPSTAAAPIAVPVPTKLPSPKQQLDTPRTAAGDDEDDDADDAPLVTVSDDDDHDAAAAHAGAGVPRAIDTDEQSAPPAKPRTSSRPMPAVRELPPLTRDDSGLRMIASLGRDRAETSGELRPSQIIKTEGEPETQRELITILPRRSTRDLPVLAADAEADGEDASAAPDAIAAPVDAATPRSGTPRSTTIATGGNGRLVRGAIAAALLLVVIVVYVKTRPGRAPTAWIASDAAPTFSPLPAVVPDAPVAPIAPVDASVAATLPADAASVDRLEDASIATAPGDAFDAVTAARKLVDQAHDAIEEGEFQKALDLSDQSLKLRRTARTYLVRGTALQRLGRVDDALDSIDLALDIYKRSGADNAAAWEQKGRMLWGAGRRDEARVAFDRFLQLEPGSGKAAQIRKMIAEPR